MPMPDGNPNVNVPVKGSNDPSVNFYGQQKMSKTATPDLKKAVDDGFANMHANLLNTGSHEDTQGESNKIDRMKAMARRMASAY